MPITVGAIRKQRSDLRKAAVNKAVKSNYKEAVHDVRIKPSAENLSEAFRQLDRAAKNKVIHKNKAARLKSRLSKLLKH
jgi:small subunit ribosomal protein S20